MVRLSESLVPEYDDWDPVLDIHALALKDVMSLRCRDRSRVAYYSQHLYLRILYHDLASKVLFIALCCALLLKCSNLNLQFSPATLARLKDSCPGVSITGSMLKLVTYPVFVFLFPESGCHSLSSTEIFWFSRHCNNGTGKLPTCPHGTDRTEYTWTR